MKISLFLFILLLTACVKSEQLVMSQPDCFNYVVVSDHKLQPVFCKDTKDWRYYKNDDISLTVPGSLFFNHTDDRTIFYTKYDNRPEQPTDYSVEMTQFSPHPQTPPCSPSTLQALDPHQREVLEISEQKDKANDLYVLRGVQRPTGPEVDLSPQKLKEWWAFQDTRYLFCSQHAGKTVVIVITQKTDNPALAKKIFDSFKWTK